METPSVHFKVCHAIYMLSKNPDHGSVTRTQDPESVETTQLLGVLTLAIPDRTRG